MSEQAFQLWAGHPVGSRLDVATLEAWWRSGGLADEVAVYPGPEIPDDPGVMLVVTMLPGAGFTLEQLLDRPSFQVRTIGPQADPAAAGELADAVDTFITTYRYPARLITPSGEVRVVVEIRRTGGRPSADRVDTAERTHYVCTYLAEVDVPPLIPDTPPDPVQDSS